MRIGDEKVGRVQGHNVSKYEDQFCLFPLPY